MQLIHNTKAAGWAKTFSAASVLAVGLAWGASALNSSARAQAAAAPVPAPAPAPSANAGPVRLAVVNVARIFNDMAETKVLQAKMADEAKKINAEQQQRDKSIQDLKNQRGGLNPNHPQYEDMNVQILKASIEFKNWADSQRALAEHNQKRQFKALFEKIQVAVGDVARERQIDLVIADNKEPLPTDTELDQIDSRTVRGLIMQKDVLFSTDRVDLSQAVLALLDKRYQGGAAAPAAAAIPGAPAPAAPVSPNK